MLVRLQPPLLFFVFGPMAQLVDAVGLNPTYCRFDSDSGHSYSEVVQLVGRGALNAETLVRIRPSELSPA